MPPVSALPWVGPAVSRVSRRSQAPRFPKPKSSFGLFQVAKAKTWDELLSSTNFFN